MIPLEYQVSSLALSQRLKELGVKQESLFVWAEPVHVWDGEVPYVSFGEPMNAKPICSAFTVAELGEMLPTHIKGVPIQLIRHGSAWGKSAEQEWWGVKYHDIVPLQDANTEANARASMLIHLIENSLIDVKTI